jgi:hypothetical protein
VLAALDPQELLAITDNVPLLVGVSVQLVPVPTGVPPPEYVQVYDVAPDTDGIL